MFRDYGFEIDAQIAAALEETGRAFDIIGNLYLNLPGGVLRSITDTGQLEEPAVARFENPQRNNFHSSRAYEVTWRTFFADIDRALQETGTDHDELQRMKSSGKMR